MTFHLISINSQKSVQNPPKGSPSEIGDGPGFGQTTIHLSGLWCWGHMCSVCAALGSGLKSDKTQQG